MSCSICYGYSGRRCPCCSASEPECRECGGSLHEDASDSERCTCYARCDCGKCGPVTRVRFSGERGVYLLCAECLGDCEREGLPLEKEAA